MELRLRKHQAEFSAVIDRIISGDPIRRVIAHVTPGGGKSLFGILSGRLIKAGLADSICWVVPRLTLSHQAEMTFVDPYFDRMLHHGLSLRAATNEVNPCRGQTGYCTTFQALAQDDKGINAREFLRKRYILIIDETHHAAADEKSLWGKALAPMVERARFVFLLSGTLSRGDGKKIAFLPYVRERDSWLPDLQDTEDTAVISYSRSDALKEKAILPIKFILSDGRVSWEDKRGRKQDHQLSRAVFNTGSAIFTALNTEFAEQLLKDGLNHWQGWRTKHPRSKLMVVTANIEHGRKILKLLQEWGYSAKIATSDDTPEAIKTINAFRRTGLDIMVSVAMCSEGFDCKPLTHIIALTHIRTAEWIAQMVARPVRVDPDAGPYSSQKAFVFAPDDPLFRQVVEQIRSEQLAVAHEPEPAEPKEGGNGNGAKEPGINPLAGEIMSTREVSLGESEISQQNIPEIIPKTIHEQEEEIRAKIDEHVGSFCFANRYTKYRINKEIMEVFKPRELLSLQELKHCLRWVQVHYPVNGRSPESLPEGISRTRGVGKRVPTKAQPWNLSLF